jgi:hypothetical protein
MSALLENLSSAEIIALSKAVKAADSKAASSELAEGDHDVDFVVRVTGSIKRGANYEQQVANKIDWALLTACLFGKVNEATAAAAMTDYLAAQGKIEKELKASANAKVAVLKTKTLTACNGKVTTKVAAEVASTLA